VGGQLSQSKPQAIETKRRKKQTSEKEGATMAGAMENNNKSNVKLYYRHKGRGHLVCIKKQKHIAVTSLN
jgi:hypothetical protein